MSRLCVSPCRFLLFFVVKVITFRQDLFYFTYTFCLIVNFGERRNECGSILVEGLAETSCLFNEFLLMYGELSLQFLSIFCGMDNKIWFQNLLFLKLHSELNVYLHKSLLNSLLFNKLIFSWLKLNLPQWWDLRWNWTFKEFHNFIDLSSYMCHV